MVEALRAFDSRWCHWNFSLSQSFRPHYGPGIDSASNRNEYQEYLLGVRRPAHRADLTTFMCRLSSNLGASTSWNPQGLSRPVMGLLYLFLFLLPEKNKNIGVKIYKTCDKPGYTYRMEVRSGKHSYDAATSRATRANRLDTSCKWTTAVLLLLYLTSSYQIHKLLWYFCILCYNQQTHTYCQKRIYHNGLLCNLHCYMHFNP